MPLSALKWYAGPSPETDSSGHHFRCHYEASFPASLLNQLEVVYPGITRDYERRTSGEKSIASELIGIQLYLSLFSVLYREITGNMPNPAKLIVWEQSAELLVASFNRRMVNVLNDFVIQYLELVGEHSVQDGHGGWCLLERLLPADVTGDPKDNKEEPTLLDKLYTKRREFRREALAGFPGETAAAVIDGAERHGLSWLLGNGGHSVTLGQGKHHSSAGHNLHQALHKTHSI